MRVATKRQLRLCEKSAANYFDCRNCVGAREAVGADATIEVIEICYAASSSMAEHILPRVEMPSAFQGLCHARFCVMASKKLGNTLRRTVNCGFASHGFTRGCVTLS
jgi:hypothetical protein